MVNLKSLPQFHDIEAYKYQMKADMMLYKGQQKGKSCPFNVEQTTCIVCYAFSAFSLIATHLNDPVSVCYPD